jgi:NitT/TauT family transport system permease protein
MTTAPTRERLLWAIASIAGFLALWQIVGSFIDPVFLSTPARVLGAVPKVAARDVLVLYLDTMALYAVSVSLAVVLGIMSGLMLGMHPRLNDVMRPVVLAMYSTPTIVLIPILVIWFGDGALPVFVLVFIASYFPMLFSTQLGVQEVGPEVAELARAFGATRRELIAKIIAPSMLPYVFSGLRIALPRGFIAIIAAEMLITARGMGGLVLYYGDAFQTDRYFVPVIMLATTAYVISEALQLLEHRMMPWRARHDA